MGEQGDQHDNVKDLESHDLNKESGDAAVADKTEESNRVQDEGVNIMADDEIQAIASDKPKRTRKKRKDASGASGYVLPPKRLWEDYGTSGDAGANTSRKSLAAI
ncbi:hypothetical protein Tco_1553449 [Tanacetum coccineum]